MTENDSSEAPPLRVLDPDSGERYLTPHDVARIYTVGYTRVLRDLRAGKIRASERTGMYGQRRYFIHPDVALEAYGL